MALLCGDRCRTSNDYWCGLRRRVLDCCLVRGRCLLTVGAVRFAAVSMDMLHADATEVDVAVGDWVEVMGS